MRENQAIRASAMKKAIRGMLTSPFLGPVFPVAREFFEERKQTYPFFSPVMTLLYLPVVAFMQPGTVNMLCFRDLMIRLMSIDCVIPWWGFVTRTGE
jgi:hypothetical protein